MLLSLVNATDFWFAFKPVNLEGKTLKVSVNTDAGVYTKTAFGDKTDAGYPTVWTSAQQVSISLNYASPKQAEVTPSADGKTATFDATVADDESGNYVFYALSPAASVISWNATYESVQVDFPASQVPTMKSVDEVAHIMAAKSETFTEFPENVSLAFSHIAAYGKFQFREFPETVTINSIELTAEEPVAGRFYFYPETGELSANSAGNTVTLDVDELGTPPISGLLSSQLTWKARL